MRKIPEDMQAHLDTGATTLCWCWRITRNDGVRLGFTDHDRDLDFDGTVFEAATGFTATEARRTVGLNVDNSEVDGALVSERLSAADLDRGLFDSAAVEVFRVNWHEPAQRLRVRVATIGEVRRSGAAFSAELRGMAHELQQPIGRSFQRACDADLGDGRCGIDITLAAWSATGTVTTVADWRRFHVSGLGGHASGLFAQGRLAWLTGENAGSAQEVRHHTLGDVVAIELWLRPPRAIAIGDSFHVTAGCDKSAETCRKRFANLVNFRGFPHIPGTDYVISYPSRGGGNTGGRL
ncbi:MAG: DUF2163 domain-containing protein [Hyphomicrobiaceae bacterium]